MDTKEFLLHWANADVGPFAGANYIARVLGTQPANLIAYWPFAETSGTNADNAEGTAARDGTFGRNVTTMGTGAGIGDGNTAPLFDATNDYCDVDTASLVSAFNGAEGTISFWAKVSGAGVWSDGTLRRLAILLVDGSNYLIIAKNPANNIQIDFNAGGTGEQGSSAAVTNNTGWWHCAVTWSKAGEVIRYYLLGTEQATDTALGTWAGSLATVVVGASNTTPTNQWDGYLAHVAIWTTPLDAGDILALATV